MSEPKPVPTSNSQSSSSASATPTPTVTTVVVPGTVITSTTYVTVPTTVTVTTTIITATRTATATVTVSATAPVATATTTTTTTTAVSPEKLEVISGERTELINQIDELINRLGQLIAVRGGIQASQDVTADINRLQQIKDRAFKAKTLEELKSLRQEFEAIKSKYASLLQQQVQATQTATTAQPGKEVSVAIATDKGQIELKFNVVSSGVGGAVTGKNIDFSATIDKDKISIKSGDQSYTLSKDEVAKLFAGLWASSNYLTRSHWELLYKLAGGDKFKEALRKWLSGEKLTEDDILALANGALALAQNRVLFDYSSAKGVKTAYYDIDISALIYESLFNSLSYAEKLNYNLNPANMFKSIDQRAQDLYNMLVEKLKKGELTTPPGEGKWTIEQILQGIAQYTPLNYVYTRIRDSLAPYVGNAVAGGVASALTTALLMSLPVIGALVGGPAGATAGAIAQQALIYSSLVSALPAVASLASQLKDPEAQKAYIEFLSKPENWKPILEEMLAVSVASGVTAIAMQKLLPVILTSPKVWNRLPEVAKQGLRSIGISPEYQYLEGKVVLAQVKNEPTQETYYVLYDPESKTLAFAVEVQGKTTIVGKQELTAELKEFMKRFLTAEGIRIEPGTPDAELARLFYMKFSDKIRGLGFTPKQIKDIIELTSKSPSAVYNFLKDYPILNKGLLAVSVDTSEGVIGVQTSQTDAVLYTATDKYAVAFATKTGTEMQSQVLKIRSLIDEAKDITRLFTGMLRQQIYVKPGDNIGNFRILANIVLTGVDEDTAKSVVNALKAYVQSLKSRTISPASGGLSVEYYLQMYNVPKNLWEPLADAMRMMQTAVMQGIDTIPVVVSSSSGASAIMVLAPLAVSEAGIQQAVRNAVEQGVKPATFGLRVVPINTQVVVPAVVTQPAETFTSTVTTTYTGITRTTGLRESAVQRIEAVPAIVTQAVETSYTKTETISTSITRTATLTEKPIHRVEAVPFVVTSTSEAVNTTVETRSTGIVKTTPLSEKPIHRTESMPIVVTQITEDTATSVATSPTSIVETRSLNEKPIRRTETVPTVITMFVEAEAPAIIPQPTAVTVTKPLNEKPVHNTETAPVVVTSTTTIVVVTTSTVTVPVTGTGTVSVVTIPVIMTYTYTVPVTVPMPGVAPAPVAPPTQTTTGTETGTVIATPPPLKLPSLEGTGATIVGAKPEQKPRLEKEVLVI